MQFMKMNPSYDHFLILSSQEQNMFGISGVFLACFLVFFLTGEFFGGLIVAFLSRLLAQFSILLSLANCI